MAIFGKELSRSIVEVTVDYIHKQQTKEILSPYCDKYGKEFCDIFQSGMNYTEMYESLPDGDEDADWSADYCVWFFISPKANQLREELIEKLTTANIPSLVKLIYFEEEMMQIPPKTPLPHEY